MATISSCYNFDNAMLKQVIRLQRQMDYGIPPGVLSALNAFQMELQPFSQISTPAWLRELNTLNAIQNTWQIPELQTIAQSVQRIRDVWSPAMQAISPPAIPELGGPPDRNDDAGPDSVLLRKSDTRRYGVRLGRQPGSLCES